MVKLCIVAQQTIETGGDPLQQTDHNAPFDLGFLSLTFSLQELRLSGQPVFDSCDLSRRRLRLPRYSLEAIGRWFGLIETESHRGLDDSLLLKEVFVRLLAKRPALRSLEALEATSRSLRFQDFSRTLAPDPPGFPGLRKAITARHMLKSAKEAEVGLESRDGFSHFRSWKPALNST